MEAQSKGCLRNMKNSNSNTQIYSLLSFAVIICHNQIQLVEERFYLA